MFKRAEKKKPQKDLRLLVECKKALLQIDGCGLEVISLLFKFTASSVTAAQSLARSLKKTVFAQGRKWKQMKPST